MLSTKISRCYTFIIRAINLTFHNNQKSIDLIKTNLIEWPNKRQQISTINSICLILKKNTQIVVKNV